MQRDWCIHQPCNWFCRARTAQQSVTVPSLSLCHMHVTVCLTHFTNCCLLITIKVQSVWKFSWATWQFWCEALLRRLVLLIALQKLSTLLCYLLILVDYDRGWMDQWCPVLYVQYLADSMSVSVAEDTSLERCPVIYLLLAWRDLLVVLASSNNKVYLLVAPCRFSFDVLLIWHRWHRGSLSRASDLCPVGHRFKSQPGTTA